jgi:hypothetical protein
LYDNATSVLSGLTSITIGQRSFSNSSITSNFAGQSFTITGGSGDGSSSVTIGQGSNMIFRTLSSSSRPGILNGGSMLHALSAITVSGLAGTMNVSGASNFTITLVASSAVTLTISSWNAATNSGYSGEFFLRVTQAAGGSGTLTLPASVKQPNGSTYTPTATANAVDILHFKTFDLTNLYLIAVYKDLV